MLRLVPQQLAVRVVGVGEALLAHLQGEIGRWRLPWRAPLTPPCMPVSTGLNRHMRAHTHTVTHDHLCSGNPPRSQAFDYACYFYNELPSSPLTPRLSPDGKDESAIDVNTLRVTGECSGSTPCLLAALCIYPKAGPCIDGVSQPSPP